MVARNCCFGVAHRGCTRRGCVLQGCVPLRRDANRGRSFVSNGVCRQPLAHADSQLLAEAELATQQADGCASSPTPSRTQHKDVTSSPEDESDQPCCAQTNGVDWIGFAVVAASLAVTIGGIFAVAKVGINFDRRPRKPSRIRRTKGEYPPPEPPEGRYWG